MKITPGLKGKTKYGTPVEILREIEPFRYNGKVELRRAEVIFFGRHTDIFWPAYWTACFRYES